MKFRALMLDSVAMREFMNITNSLSKLSKSCIIRITSKNVYFIISEEDSGPRRPLVWCDLPVSFYFKEFNVVGVTPDINEIYLEFATAMFAKSLNTLKNGAKSLKIKLTDKQMPCITLEFELASSDSIQYHQCVHDIPVDIISKKHWGDYAEPKFNDFHVTIKMPCLKPIKNIVDRMKNVSHSLIVSATKDGRLTLRTKTNMVTLSAHFPDLSVESFAVGQMQNHINVDEEETVLATVDIKKFLNFLNGMQVNNCRTTCSIVNEKMVKLHLEQPGVLSLECFLTELSI